MPRVDESHLGADLEPQAAGFSHRRERGVTPLGRGRLLIAKWFPRTLELEGSGSLLPALASRMSDLGWDVRLLLPAGKNLEQAGVALLQYPGGIAGIRGYLRAVREFSRDADAALLLEQAPSMAFVAGSSRCSGRTLCYFFTPLEPLSAAWRGGLNLQALVHAIAKNGLWTKLQRWQRLRCIVQTRYQADQLSRLRPAELHVVPGCGIPRTRSIPDRRAARETLGWDERPVVGYLGHYSRAKGVEVLIEAMAHIQEGVLALAHSGKGRLTSAAVARLDALREAGRVREVGVTDAVVFLAACDVVALPYITSSIHHLPQVLMESHAAATAVITTDVGGVSDGHRDGETGWLVPAGDTDALCRALRAVLTDLELCHAIGRSARRIFESRWCIEVFAEALDTLLARRQEACMSEHCHRMDRR